MTPDPKLEISGELPAQFQGNGSREGSVNGEIAPSGRKGAGRRTSTARLWLRRLGVLLFVFLCATLGVMLMIVPWRPEWTENRLLLPYPTIRDLALTGFVRGVVTGLGLLNVWMGFWEAIQYREDL
jgi:hypothetical protein